MKYLFFLVLTLMFFGQACQSGPSPQDSAKKFCSCAAQFSDAHALRKVNPDRMPERVYEDLEKELNACLGESPMAALKTEKDSLDFMKLFVQTLYTDCPNVARNLDFKAE